MWPASVVRGQDSGRDKGWTVRRSVSGRGRALLFHPEWVG